MRAQALKCAFIAGHLEIFVTEKQINHSWTTRGPFKTELFTGQSCVQSFGRLLNGLYWSPRPFLPLENILYVKQEMFLRDVILLTR